MRRQLFCTLNCPHYDTSLKELLTSALYFFSFLKTYFAISNKNIWCISKLGIFTYFCVFLKSQINKKIPTYMFYLNSNSFSWGYVFVSAGLVTLFTSVCWVEKNCNLILFCKQRKCKAKAKAQARVCRRVFAMCNYLKPKKISLVTFSHFM